MLEKYSPSDLSRRSLLLVAAGLASPPHAYAFGKEFWDAKDPAEWNSDEIARLLSKSPWARVTTAERAGSPKNSPRLRLPRRGPGGLPRERAPRNVTTYKGVVVWESAAPVRTALKTPLPDGFDRQYVLGVSGVPLACSDSNNALDRLRQLTTLQCKGRPPVEAVTVQEDTSNGTVYLCGFSREALPISREDRDLVFTTHMGRIAFTAKFDPKNMLYHGELAV